MRARRLVIRVWTGFATMKYVIGLVLFQLLTNYVKLAYGCTTMFFVRMMTPKLVSTPIKLLIVRNGVTTPEQQNPPLVPMLYFGDAVVADVAEV
ncbi:unnamed protein product [Heligmosomoides polygyrus]|uniref:Secreted protein n=1 Tax=Heligmosomoides polygyrus TaxID=6339 RepID=A0A183G798_HELPZ|nr:unnamed protein product [Heligmosomoides polygyrus]